MQNCFTCSLVCSIVKNDSHTGIFSVVSYSGIKNLSTSLDLPSRDNIYNSISVN